MSGARISIVVPVVGAPAGLEETLASLEAQAWPALQVVVERDAANVGQALENGFGRAEGEIHGWIEPGDVLLPGALQEVAAAFEGEPGRGVVLGNALWRIGDEPPVPHPSEWLGQYEHLAIWKRRFDTLPQPSLFWRREASHCLSPFLHAEGPLVAYDIACRLGTRFAIERVDSVWSVARLRTASALSEAQLLDAWTRISRASWGPWWKARRWRLAASLAWHQRHPHEHARHHARRAEKALAERRRLEAIMEALKAWCWSPAMVRGRFAYLRADPRKSR
ncbi:MAG TPA: hypothetical protein VFJ62_03905 [Usitatibacter sp.]|nr:hypothetical protein [Usitatibacter sp.]